MMFKCWHLEWEYLTLLYEWLNNHLKGLNAPTIVWPFSILNKNKFLKIFLKKKIKPCDDVGDDDDDDDEIEDDLLCSSLSLSDWFILLLL